MKVRSFLRFPGWVGLGWLLMAAFGASEILAQSPGGQAMTISRPGGEMPRSAAPKPAVPLTTALPPGRIDLSVKEFRVSPEKAGVGEMVELAAVVVNLGERDLERVRVRIWADQRPLGRDQVIRLRAGGQETVRARWKAEGAGVHELRVVVDPDHEWPEGNKQNNAATRKVETLPPVAVVVRKPDGTPQALTAPVADAKKLNLSRPAVLSKPTLLSPGFPNLVLDNVQLSPVPYLQGDLLTLSFDVKNKGTGRAEPRPQITIRKNETSVYVDAPGAPGTYLDPGQSFHKTLKFKGECRHKLRIEVGGDPRELQKEDNVWEKEVAAQSCYPDLAVTEFTYELVQIKPNAGADIRLKGAVRNLQTAEVNHPGTVYLAKGSKSLKAVSFSKVGPQDYFPFDFPTTFSCLFGPDQPAFSLSVEYAPPAPGSDPKKIDVDMTNNKKEISALELCTKIQGQSSGGTVTGLLNLINQHRQKNGLKPLSQDGCLSTAAQKHSQWMNTTGTFSHNGENGSQPWNRCSQAGCACSAENIDQNGWDLTGQKTFDAWLNSPGHNANMLGPYGQIGIGVAGSYVTADFN